MLTTRRKFIALFATVIAMTTRKSFSAVNGNFDTELQNTLNNQDLLARLQALPKDKSELTKTRGTVHSRIRSETPISKRAINLIVGFEVTDQKTYESKYRGVIRPGGASGITCGIGYDVGYVTPKDLFSDWSGYIADQQIRKLSKACGVTGLSAEKLKANLVDVSIPWEVAYRQFIERVIPIYVAATERALQNTTDLSQDSLGALVSLAYNRGPSFRLTGPRYAEMRTISRLMRDKNFVGIPDQIEAMRRLWITKDVIGLQERRHLEALLFQRGLP